MSNYEDEEDDELQNEEPAPAAENRPARSSGNRNFFIALGILALIFILVTAFLVFLYFSRSRGTETADIRATNSAIETANVQTAVAAT
jgi:flagellar basal body-associated protein FliL